MTEENLLEMLRDAVKVHGSQGKVAKILGLSSATVSLVLNGSYPGSIEAVLTRVEEVFGTREMDCPVLGIIPLNRCVAERRKDFSTANPLRVRLYRACMRCVNNTDHIRM